MYSINSKDNYLKKELYSLMLKDSSIFEFITSNALDGMWYWDLENPENEWMDDKFWKTLGYNPKKMPHKAAAWQNIIHPDDLKTATDNFIKHCEDPNHPYDQEVRYKHKKGHTVWVRCKGVVIRDENDKPTRMLGTHIDITPQKKAQEKLALQNKRYSHIIKGTNIGTWEWNVQTNETRFNERWAEIIGYTLEEISPVSIETWVKHSHPDDLEKSNKLLQDHFEGKTEFYVHEGRMKHKDGHWVWIVDRGKVVSWTDDGKPLLMTGSHIDITYRKKNELLLENYKDLLERSNAAAKIGTWEVDLEKNEVSWSNTTREIHEVPDSFSPNFENAFNFYPEGENREKIEDAVNQAINNGVNYDIELQIKTYKNNLKWVRAIGIIDSTKDIKRFYGLFQDIDELKKSQLKIALREEQFRQTFEYSSIGMALVGLDGKWLDVNKSVCDIVGYPKKELLKLTFQDITHPDDLTLDLNLLQELIDGKRSSYQLEKRYFTKNGDIVWVNLSVSMVKNDKGEPIHFVSQIQDITEKKRLLDTLEDQNKRLINFAHIVSHNLRSHTGNIGMLLSLFESEYPDLVVNNELFGHLTDASKNLNETVQHLNEVVVINTKIHDNLQKLNLNEFAQKALENVSGLAKDANCAISNKTNNSTMVMAIPAYLESIIINFLTNAIKYRSPKRVSRATINNYIDGNYCVLQITDNGLGIDLEKHGKKLFGMYKTFHNNKNARGIGLFITKNQVEAMGGKIEVNSQVDVGTEFKIYLKLAS